MHCSSAGCLCSHGFAVRCHSALGPSKKVPSHVPSHAPCLVPRVPCPALALKRGGGYIYIFMLPRVPVACFVLPGTQSLTMLDMERGLIHLWKIFNGFPYIPIFLLLSGLGLPKCRNCLLRMGGAFVIGSINTVGLHMPTFPAIGLQTTNWLL